MTAPLISRWTVADGRRWHSLAGPPGGPPVVLVHGFVISSREWGPTAQRLAAPLEVLIPDLPGFGRTPGPRRVLDIAELADALAAWMHGPAAVVGHSFGCEVATALAVRHRRLVERLALVGPVIEPARRSAPLISVRLAADFLLERPSILRVAVGDLLAAGLARALRTLAVMVADPVEERLGEIRAPTLIVRGERDPVTSRGWAERVAGEIPDARLTTLPCAAHLPTWSAPDELAAVLLPFLA